VPDIPPEVRDFIAGQIGLLWDCSESYPWHSSTFDLHLAQVRESTGWRFASGADKYADKATPVFLGQRGRLTPRGFQLLLERYTKAANLKDVTPHSRRHSFCKNLANAGVSLEKIAVLAGHESLETTRRYCEPSLGELQEAVELVSEEE
jgi:integrase